ncbi:glycine cleavage system aminomethyltransferase GcvT [Sphingosinicella sp. LHD-64]|uniref:glycine cleavage system aminomethyltransferase GcvT n=1 Tax=Sphingosinicella sp. LHD-64 TaxID=3072139 RepID=UPI00280DB31A|nr:glycine cleavage system aminomethyltransferase GcvT [Sphingosinicella sp. LHD-64]MDQ8757662.1 glycine cleavage system aminomethyltransferase GcvT [Sphingosinicella sp. LHD-64]
MSEPEKTLPLDQWHRARGARMVEFAGYAMPIQYEGIMAEHKWTREQAGLFDVSHMGQVIVAGAEAEKGLEALLPADLAILKDSKPKYSLLLTEDGGIIDDLMVTRRGDHFYLVVNGATKNGDIAHMESRLPRGAVLDHMKEQALLALQGPKAVDVLARLVPGVEDLTFMTAGAFTIAGVPAWISRSGYTGEDGYEISVPARAVEDIATLIADQPEVKPIGLGARDSLRLEAGLPLYGHDLDFSTTPVEADLVFALSKRRREEGGFPGWHRIARELADGPIRKRVGLAVEGRQPVREGAMVVDGEGNEVGKVTSGGFSPSTEAPIAMAYVPAAAAAPGASVLLSQRGKLFNAKVVPMPFVPHRYHRKGAPK